jgi:hypothetical protein
LILNVTNVKVIDIIKAVIAQGNSSGTGGVAVGVELGWT